MAALSEPLPLLAPGRVRSAPITLADGARTMVHVASHDLCETELRVAVLRRPVRLEPWCARRGVREALVGGFFVRPQGTPLGEVRTRGIARAHVPFEAPWDGVRACVHVCGGTPAVARRDELPRAPRGDLLQAGPLLVSSGVPVYDRARDPEGFSAGARQFDSDITAERHPRAAFGLAGTRMYAAVCDGRARDDAGMTLEEMASLMASLGCESALNLDGGGSASLVSGGRLQNAPRREWETPEPGGRAVSTALLFLPRRG